MESLKGFKGLVDIKMEATDLHDQLNYPYKEDIISRFDGGVDLGIPSNEIFPHNSLFMNDQDDETAEEDEDVIILHIDIRQPIKQLRTLLEQRTGMNLSKYEFWLQDAQALEPHKNLVDQCVKGEGLVQINAQVRTHTRRINIVDVLKPTDDALAEISQMMDKSPIGPTIETDDTTSGMDTPPLLLPPSVAAASAVVAVTNIADQQMDEEQHSNGFDDGGGGGGAGSAQMVTDATAAVSTVLSMDEEDDDDEDDSACESTMKPLQLQQQTPKPQWIIDTQFRKDQMRLKISDDPREWTVAQVKHWLQWAVRQFNLTQIKLQDWSISGRELNDLTIEEFRQKVPHDPENIFWTHLELLRRLKVAAVQGEVHDADDYTDDASHCSDIVPRSNRAIGIKSTVKPIKPLGIMGQFGLEATQQQQQQQQQQGNRTGNNGQIQLWQFLLEILTDREHKDIISWIGGQGEFKLTDPERVAQLWGERKNKPTMNYEKLSRALRYYYDGDMISKVHGKRFVYKFVCDLTQLIGYNAQELSNLVNDTEDVDPIIYNDFRTD